MVLVVRVVQAFFARQILVAQVRLLLVLTAHEAGLKRHMGRRLVTWIRRCTRVGVERCLSRRANHGRSSAGYVSVHRAVTMVTRSVSCSIGVAIGQVTEISGRSGLEIGQLVYLIVARRVALE